ncbi:MAG: hypothetical protein KDH09_06950, partial [Chrysiogenetes bacterium]|nr:hypothetical protein [Chrysiogenetes bacterium]
MMVDADAIQAGVIAAVNGEDSDCGPDNTHTEASAGSVLVEGLFGAWSFTTTHAGGLEGPTTVQEPGQDAYALASLLRYFGVSYLSSVVPNVAAQAALEDTWPTAGPYAYYAQETVNCNNDGMMDDGDDSNGTVTVTASIRGEVLAEMSSVKDIPSQETPSNATITDIVYIVTYNNCDVIGKFWGDATEETVTLSGTTTTRIKYDPALQGMQQANDAQETADFSGTVFASNGSDTGVMVINAKDVGIDDGG